MKQFTLGNLDEYLTSKECCETIIQEIEESLVTYNQILAESLITSLTKVFYIKNNDNSNNNYFENHINFLISRFFSSLTKEINIKEELILGFFNNIFKYYRQKGKMLSISFNLQTKIIDLGNFGQSPNNRKISVYLSRKYIFVNKNEENIELLNRIIRLKTDAEYSVRLEISKSFSLLYKYSKEDKYIKKSTFEESIIPIIRYYIEKEERIEILYYSLKVGLACEELKEASTNKLLLYIDKFCKEKDLNEIESTIQWYYKLLIKNDNYKSKDLLLVIEKFINNIIKPYNLYDSFFNNIEILCFLYEEIDFMKEIAHWIKIIENIKDKDKEKDKDCASLNSNNYMNTNSSSSISINSNCLLVNKVKAALFNSFESILKIIIKNEMFNKLLLKLFQEYWQSLNQHIKEYYSKSCSITLYSKKETKEAREILIKSITYDNNFCKLYNKLSSLLELIESKENNQMLNVIIDNSEHIESIYKGYDWREISVIIKFLMKGNKLYSVECFLERILKVNKAFYTNCPSEKQNSKIIMINIELTIHLIQFCSNSNIDEFLPYVEIYFLRGSYFSLRYIFTFFEQFIIKFSFGFFCKHNFFSLSLTLLHNENCNIVKQSYEFLKRLLPIIEFYPNYKQELDAEIEKLEASFKIISNDKSLICKQNRNKEAFLNFKQFRFNILKDKYVNIFNEDKIKNEKVEANLDKLNCTFLANKQQPDSNNVSFYNNSSKNIMLDRRPKKIEFGSSNYSSYMNIIDDNKISVISKLQKQNKKNKIEVNKTISGSFNKSLVQKLKSPPENITRPFSPEIQKSTIKRNIKISSPLILPIDYNNPISRKASGIVSNYSINLFNSKNSNLNNLSKTNSNSKKDSLKQGNKFDLPTIVTSVSSMKFKKKKVK